MSSGLLNLGLGIGKIALGIAAAPETGGVFALRGIQWLIKCCQRRSPFGKWTEQARDWNKPVGGFISSALAGNTFSSITDLVTSIRTGSGGGQNVFYNMGQSVLSEPRQGIPGGKGPWGGSATGLATDAIVAGVHTGISAGGELTTLAGTASTVSLTEWNSLQSGFGAEGVTGRKPSARRGEHSGVEA